MEYIKKYIAEFNIYGDKEEIRILKYPNGKYYIHYGWMEKHNQGKCIAGGFATLREAETMLKKHRPTAEEVKEEKTKYIGNARIIESLEELPKIGEKRGADMIISIEMQEEKEDGYIIYKVKYLNGKFIDTDMDIYYFTYAIQPENIK